MSSSVWWSLLKANVQVGNSFQSRQILDLLREVSTLKVTIFVYDNPELTI